MGDDQDFNINFVQLVEQHPCLYDHTLPDYHRTRAQHQAWIAIGNEIKENVPACKTRWRNLRGRYTKYLREYTPSGSGTVNKKPYYLAEFMVFLEPFTKSHQTMKESVKRSYTKRHLLRMKILPRFKWNVNL